MNVFIQYLVFYLLHFYLYRWKALDLCFSNKGTPLLCLGALRPYWGIYGSSKSNRQDDRHYVNDEAIAKIFY